MSKVIREFFGETRWLSNFAGVKIVWNGMTFPSTENAYQASKIMSPDVMVDVPTSGGLVDDAKVSYWELCQTCSAKVSKAVSTLDVIKDNTRKDWKQVNLALMYDFNKQKFTQEPYRSQLIATGDAELQEGNSWGDLFWGVDKQTGAGLNHLGKIIMAIRDELNGKTVNGFDTL